MSKLYYVRGALGNHQLLQDHQEDISRLVEGNYHSKNLEKLKGHEVYSYRLSNKARLLFTLINLDKKNHLLLLDYLANHEYHRSRFLRSGMLNRYLEQHKENHLHQIQRQELVFNPLTQAELAVCRAYADRAQVGESPLFPVEYYQHQVIALNKTQEQASTLSLPAIVSGVAGSGKSCVGLSMMARYLETQTEKMSILFVCQSAELIRRQAQAWQQLPIAVDSPHEVVFISYDELVRQRANTTNSLVGAEFFELWFSAYSKRKSKAARAQNTDYLVSTAEIVYQEFRICSALKEAEYLHIGSKQSLVTPEQRAWIYQTYTDYLAYLDSEQVIDSGFYSLPGDASYELIVVDEAQDLSHQQLKCLSELAKNKQIVYFMDSHQRIYDQISIYPYLKQMLSTPTRPVACMELPIAYRCPLKVVAIANEVIALKQQLAGGLAHKNESRGICTLTADPELGGVYRLFSQTQDNEWLRVQAQGSNFAVVTLAAYRKEAEELFSASIVMTPEEIKGLEYDLILAYRVFPPEFKSARQRLLSLGETAKQPMHQPKAGAADERFGPMLNRIYTSYTRAKRLLVIYEEANLNTNILLHKFDSLLDKGPLANEVLEILASPEDWHAQVLQQLAVGNKDLALNLFITKQLGDKTAFEALLLQHQSEPGSIAISHDEIGKPEPPMALAVLKPKIAPIEVKIPKASSKEPSISQKTAPVVIATPALATREGVQALGLQNNFCLKRLSLVLTNDFDLKAVFLKPYLNEQGIQFVLADKLKKIEHVKVLFECCLSNLIGRVLAKLPVKKLVNYLKESNSCLEEMHQLKKLKKLCTHGNGKLSLNYAIHIVTESNNLEYLAFLLRMGANVNQVAIDGLTPFMMSISNKNLNLASFLIKNGAQIDAVSDEGASAFSLAVQFGCIHTVRFLIENKVDINQRTKNGYTAAHIAAQCGKYEILSLLLEASIDVNQANGTGVTLLMIAVKYGQTKIINLLLRNKANIHLTDADGTTALLMAAQSGYPEILEKLIQLGSDIHVNRKNGTTSAYHAAYNGHVNILRQLKSKGIDIDGVVPDGTTPAFIAVMNNHISVIRFLINEKGDVTTPCVASREALGRLLNKWEGYSEVIARLNEKIKFRINRGDDEQNIKISPLDLADVLRHGDIFKLLFDHLKSTSKTAYSPEFFPSPLKDEDIKESVKSIIPRNRQIG